MTKFQQVVRVYQNTDKYELKLDHTNNIEDGFTVLWTDITKKEVDGIRFKKSWDLDLDTRFYMLVRNFSGMVNTYIDRRY